MADPADLLEADARVHGEAHRGGTEDRQGRAAGPSIAERRKRRLAPDPPPADVGHRADVPDPGAVPAVEDRGHRHGAAVEPADVVVERALVAEAERLMDAPPRVGDDRVERKRLDAALEP